MKQSIDQVFEVGKQYTIYRINGMAMTSKQEITVTRLLVTVDPTAAAGDFVYKERGKRKEYGFRLRTRSYSSAPLVEFEGAVFEGWNQPITCDTDGANCYRGNACYNFMGLPLQIKTWIDMLQLNPNFNKSYVLAVGSTFEADEIPVYPELYKGDCAPMTRAIEKMKEKEDARVAEVIEQEGVKLI